MPPARPRHSTLTVLRRTKAALGPLWWYGALLFVVSRIGDLVNLYTGAFLIPALIPETELGAVPPLLKLAGLIATPVGLLLTPAEKYFNVFFERGELGRAKSLLRDVLCAAALVPALAAGILLLHPGPILERLAIRDSSLLVFAVLLGAIGCARPLFLSASRAFNIFSSVVWAGAPGPFLRLAALWLFTRFWPLRGFLLAQAIGDAAGLIIVAFAVLRFLQRCGKAAESYRPYRTEMLRYAAPLVLCNILAASQAFVEAFVIRQRLPESVSAANYFIEMFALIPFYFGEAIKAFLFPTFSSKHEHGQKTGAVLGQAMALSLCLGLGSTLLLFVVSPWLLSLREAWHCALPFAGFVSVVALGKTLRMTADCFVLHEQACRRFHFLWHYVPLLALSTLGLYALVGWDFFQPYLPAPLWQRVAQWPRNSLPFILAWSAAWNGLILLASILQLALRHRKRRNR